MKRKTVFIELGGVFGAGGPNDTFMPKARVMGVCKKTGQVWVKSRFFQTQRLSVLDLIGA